MTFDKIQKLVASDGTVFGDLVPNSRFVRNFCWECQEPLRTSVSSLLKPQYCEICGKLAPEENNRQTLSREKIFDLIESYLSEDITSENNRAETDDINAYSGFQIRRGTDLDRDFENDRLEND